MDILSNIDNPDITLKTLHKQSHIPSSAAESRGRSGRHTRERRPTAVWSFERPANIVWGVLGVPLYLDLLLDRRLVGQEVEIVERIAPRLWDAAPGAPVAHVAARVHGAGRQPVEDGVVC